MPINDAPCNVPPEARQAGASYTQLLETVVSPGYCIGCGVCAGLCPEKKLAMTENEYGEYLPSCLEGCDRNCGLCASVCPFFRNEDNESTLAARKFGGESGVAEDPVLGYVTGAYVGYNTDTAARQRSASGGLAHLVLQELLRRGEVDAVLAPRPIDGRPWFRMHVHEDEASVAQSRGSVYHVMPWDEVVRTVIEGGERRYAVIGLPCVIKALRLAQQRMPKLQRRIPYALGLTCGTVKTLAFPDTLARFAGTTADRLLYRGKHGNRPANHFDLVVEGGGSSKRLPFQKAYGFLWVNGYAQPKACLFCDDVFAETADVTFMDAWLPQFMGDPKGTSLAICRTEAMRRTVSELLDSGKADGGPIAPEHVVQSQAGVVRRKRHMLAARCEAASRLGQTVPAKRTELLPPPDESMCRQAVGQLRAWREWRDLAQRLLDHSTLRSALAPRTRLGRMCGKLGLWLFCLRYGRLLRRQGAPVYAWRFLLAAGWIPGPRLLWARLKNRLRRKAAFRSGTRTQGHRHATVCGPHARVKIPAERSNG
jgi:coenzyme F420 hydrogenase subunit beta